MLSRKKKRLMQLLSFFLVNISYLQFLLREELGEWRRLGQSMKLVVDEWLGTGSNQTQCQEGEDGHHHLHKLMSTESDYGDRAPGTPSDWSCFDPLTSAEIRPQGLDNWC